MLKIMIISRVQAILKHFVVLYRRYLKICRGGSRRFFALQHGFLVFYEEELVS